jgi:hypothetical protein
MRRITIMSGPAKFRILAIVGVISIFVEAAGCSSSHSTELAEFYSRRLAFSCCVPEKGIERPDFFAKTGNKSRVRSVVLTKCNAA